MTGASVHVEDSQALKLITVTSLSKGLISSLELGDVSFPQPSSSPVHRVPCAPEQLGFLRSSCSGRAFLPPAR